MVWYPKIFAIKKKGTTGTELPFPSGRCSIGGDPSCDVQIRSAGSAHCLLLIDANKQAHVVNVAGTKEVLRNDEHVPNQAFLSHGDIVTVGSRQFRFEWVSSQKKEGKQASPAATGSQQHKGGPRESSTMESDMGKESPAVQQVHGTPGVATPTTSFFDQSLYKTPCIPTEVFVSPLSASNSSNAGHQIERRSRSRSATVHGAARNGEATVHAKRLSWNDGLPNSPSELSDFTGSRKLLKAKRQSAIATTFLTPTQGVGSPKGCDGSGIDPVAESPVNGQLYDSSASTPLIDEPRMRAMRSRSSLASMADTSAEHERSASLRRLSKSLVKRRQSSEITTEENSPKVRRQNDCEDAQDTSLASHNDCNGQSVSRKSLGENSVEECTTHIKGLVTSGTASGILVASTPVAGVISRNRMKTGSARKSNKLLWQAQANRSVYSTPEVQSSCPASSAATPELSFLSSRSSSRMALRRFKGNQSLDGLQTSNILDDTLGCELMFKTPGSSFNLSATKELNSKGNGMVHDVSDSSAHNEPAHKSLVNASQATDTSLLHTSGRRRSTALTKMSEHNDVPELEMVGTSPSLHSMNTAMENSFSVTRARSSRTSVSKKVDSEVLEGGVFGTPNALNTSRAKRTPASKKLGKETTKQGVVATPQSLKVSNPKHTPASKKTKEEEVPEQEIVGASLSEHVSSGNVNVALGDSFEYGSAPASVNVSAGKPEVGSTPSNLSASRSKRTPALQKANKETTKQEMSGTTESVNILGTKGTPAVNHVNEKEHDATSMSLFKDASLNDIDITLGEPVSSARAARSGRVSASRTPASRKPNEKLPDQEIINTPRMKNKLVSDKMDGENPQQGIGDRTHGYTTVENRDAVLEESFRSRSTRSSRTPASYVVHMDTPELVAVGTPNSSNASKAKRTPALKKASKEGSSPIEVDTPGPLNISGPHEIVASKEVGGFEQHAVSAQISDSMDVAAGEPVRTRRSSRMPASKEANEEVLEQKALGTPGTLNISSAKCTPVSAKTNDSSRQEVVNTPHSKRVSVYKQTPASNKANRKASEQETMETSPFKHLTSGNTDVLKEPAKTRNTRSSCTPSSKEANTEIPEQDAAGTPGTAASSKANCTTPFGKGSEETKEGGVAQSIRTSGAKRTPASKKVQQNEAAELNLLDTSPLKQPTSVSMHADLEESVRTRSGRLSTAPALKSPYAEVPGQDTVSTPSTLICSRDTRTRVSMNEETTKQGVADTTKYLRASGAKHTPASNKLYQESEPSEQESLSTSPSKHVTAGVTEVAVAESIKKRHSRTIRTPVSKKASAEVSQEEAVGTPSTRNASKAESTLASDKNLQSSRISGARKTPALNKRNQEGKATEQETRGTSPLEDATSDNTYAAVEESVRKGSARLSHTMASRKLSAEMPERDIIRTPSTASGSRAMRMSASTNEEIAKQDTVDTRRPFRAAEVKQTPASTKANKGTPQHNAGGVFPSTDETMGLSPFKHEASGGGDVADEGSVKTGGRPSRTSTSKKLNSKVSQQHAVDALDTLNASGVNSTLVSMKTDETAQLDVGSPHSSRALRAKRSLAPNKVNEVKEAPMQETVGGSPSKHIISDSTDIAGKKLFGRRSARSSSSKALKNGEQENLQNKATGTPNTSFSIDKQGTFVREPNDVSTEHKTVNAPIKRAKLTPASTKLCKEQEVPGQETVNEPLSAAVEESVRPARSRSSCTLASKKVSVGTPDPEAVLGDKEVALSGKANEEEKQEAFTTPKSSKVSGDMQKPASGNVTVEDTQHEALESRSECGTSNGADVAVEGCIMKKSARASGTPASKKTNLETVELEAVGAQSSSRSKRTVASKVSGKLTESNAGKSRRKPASCNVNDQDEAPEQELIGMSPSEHVAADITDIAVAKTPTRSVRSSCTPASRHMDADVAEFESVGMRSSPGAKRTPASKVTNDLDQERIDTQKSSKAAGAKRTSVPENVNEKEETSAQINNVNVGLEGSARPVRSTRSCRTVASRKVNVEVSEQETAEQPHQKKASRAKRTQVSRKVNEECEAPVSLVEPLAENVVSSEKEPVQSTVKGRRKRATAVEQEKERDQNCEPAEILSSPKMPEQEREDEVVTLPQTSTTKRGRGRRATAVKQEKEQDQNCEPTETLSSRRMPEQEHKDEATLPPTSTTRRGRGKRALLLPEEGVETKLSTVEDNVGTIQKKRGRPPKQVAPYVEVSEQNDAEESSKKMGVSSKSTKLRRVASSKQEKNDEAPANGVLCSEEAMLAASSRRSKRKVAEVTATDIDHSTAEVTPKKTRGRRAKAVESVHVTEQGSAIKTLKNEQAEEMAPAKRTRKRL
ncbi:streptococcal hemagglutinin-like isoform X2 [Dermacentor albipictus]|uniref:streptococcal hemagglutinin-like isoform X2 n=1 Tax=Dermacentor albipictus TaxID=60249 RepID=UPI0031FCE2A6